MESITTYFRGNELLLINALNAGAVIGDLKDEAGFYKEPLTLFPRSESKDSIDLDLPKSQEYVLSIKNQILEIKTKCIFYLNRIVLTFDKKSNVLSRNVALLTKVVDIFIKNTSDLNILMESLELAARVKSMLNDPFMENGFEEHIKNALDIKYKQFKKK